MEETWIFSQRTNLILNTTKPTEVLKYGHKLSVPYVSRVEICCRFSSILRHESGFYYIISRPNNLVDPNNKGYNIRSMFQKHFTFVSWHWNIRKIFQLFCIVFGNTKQFLAIVRQFLTMPESFCNRQIKYAVVRQFLVMSDNFRHCQIVTNNCQIASDNVKQFLQLSHHFWQFQPFSGNARQFLQSSDSFL